MAPPVSQSDAECGVTAVPERGRVEGSSTRVRRKMASWNLGGQKLDKVDAVCGSLDFLAAQEMPRRDAGWSEDFTDGFTWLSHRGADQWRPVGVAIANDLYDCCTDKVAFDKGAAWVVRLRNSKRIVLGSLHLPTGVPTRKYHEDVQKFRHALIRWRPDLPCLFGVDVNEVVDWTGADEEEQLGNVPMRSGAKLDKVLEAVADVRMQFVAPRLEDRAKPTHYPRDESREGRHIDAVLCRQFACSHVTVNEEVRLYVNTDHARLECDVMMSAPRWGCWFDSRPRWVKRDADVPAPSTWSELEHVAKVVTCPKHKASYTDSAEIKAAIVEAKSVRGDVAKARWKEVHRLRREHRKQWKKSRLGRTVAGDWAAYREHKAEMKRHNWWGRLLQDRSSGELADAVKTHLETKVCDPELQWRAELRERVARIDCRPDLFRPVAGEEVAAALGKMKSRSALGPDGVGVDLLKKVFEAHPDALCHLLGETLRSGVLPDKWGESLLALLPKTKVPETEKELRPIAMSCAGMKLMSKVVMGRTFRSLREASPWSACGAGRGTADLHGVLGRLRDMTREWRLGVVVAKLDIEGAFDFVHRTSVADFLGRRLAGRDVPFEWRFLLLLLQDNELLGCAPGGQEVRVRCNRGIRQGSPESAEIFGLLVSDVVNELKQQGKWHEARGDLADMPADVGTYQDDIFLWTEHTGLLSRNIAALAAALGKHGLRLAVNKTTVIASKYYKGRRTVDVGGTSVPIQPAGTSVRVLGLDYDLDAPAGQQARELHGRVWAAFHENKGVLCGPGTWGEKHKLVQMLVESSWSWAAGAAHWNSADLQMMNSTQLRVLRLVFGVRRTQGEDWVTYNSRSLRMIRVWLAQAGVERWSSKILRLQFQLAGHWMRQWEGEDHRGLAGRMMLWRSLGWWNREKSLLHGVRHPRRFRAANLERSLATCLGEKWFHACAARDAWRQLLVKWVCDMDVPWAKGRQLCLCD